MEEFKNVTPWQKIQGRNKITAVLQHWWSERNGCVLLVLFACDCHVGCKSVLVLVRKY